MSALHNNQATNKAYSSPIDTALARYFPRARQVFQSDQPPHRRKMLFETLESRLLLSGDVIPVVDSGMLEMGSTSEVACWVGGNGNWMDASHWDIGIAPNNTTNKTYKVVLDTDGNVSITVNEEITIESLANSENLQIADSIITVTNQAINSGNIQITGSNSKLILSGDVSNTGSLAVTAGKIECKSTVWLNDASTLSSTENGLYRLTGNLLGDASSNNVNVTQASLCFEGNGTAIYPQLLEVMSHDSGWTEEAFNNGATFGSLSITNSTILMLTDQSDNAAETEALYCNHLVVDAGSTLFLNNMSVYVKEAQIDGRVFWGPMPSGFADLVVDGVATTPGTPVSGNNVTVSWNEKNIGSGIANGYWYDRLIVRNKTTGSILIDAVINHDPSANGAIDAGSTAQVSYTLTLPEGDSEIGPLEATVTIDAGDWVFEHNDSDTAETNNTTSIEITSRAALPPDLEVRNLSFAPEHPSAGGLVTIHWEDANTGESQANADWSDHLVVRNTSSDITLLDTYIPHAVAQEGGVLPGSSLARQITFYMPWGDAGSGYIEATVTADTNDSQHEINITGTGETNNMATVGTTTVVVTYPDLQVENLVVTPSEPGAGDIITISWSDANTGEGVTTGYWPDHILVRNITTNYVVLDNYIYHTPWIDGDIEAGCSKPRNYEFYLPGGPASIGTLEAIVTVDSTDWWWGQPEGMQHEQNVAGTAESNNSATILIALKASPQPDLQVSNLAFSPSNLDAGDLVKISWKDINTGDKVANSSWYDHLVVQNLTTGAVVIDSYIYHDSATEGEVAAGAGLERSYNFYLTEPGQLQATVTTDGVVDYWQPNGWLFEHNPGGTGESNNTATTMAMAKAADLVVQNLTIQPTELQSGCLVTVYWNDVNSGDGTAKSNWYDRLTVRNANTNNILHEAFIYHDAASEGFIAAGALLARSYNFRLPEGDAGVGEIEFTVGADHSSYIPTQLECNNLGTGESNNSACVVLLSEIANYPDMEIQNLNITPTDLVSGSSVTISWNDFNIGTCAPTLPWFDHVLVKLNGEKIHEDYEYYSPLHNGELPPQTGVARSNWFYLPHGLEGVGELEVTVSVNVASRVIMSPLVAGHCSGLAS